MVNACPVARQRYGAGDNGDIFDIHKYKNKNCRSAAELIGITNTTIL